MSKIRGSIGENRERFVARRNAYNKSCYLTASRICSCMAPEGRLPLQHFSSDLTLITFAIHRHSYTAKVFELVSSLSLSLSLEPLFLFHPRPFFLALPWHVFRAKKSRASNEGRKKKERDINLLFWSGQASSAQITKIKYTRR